mgnify:CR=1 FL=1
MEADLQLDVPLYIAGPLVLFCLLLAAYLSAAETAITGASRQRMHRLAQQGNTRATMVNELLDRKDETVSAVLLGKDDEAAFHMKRYRIAYPAEYERWKGPGAARASGVLAAP